MGISIGFEKIGKAVLRIPSFQAFDPRMRVVAGVRVNGVANLRGNPGKAGIKRDGFFGSTDGPFVVFFGALQGDKGKGAGIFLFVAGLLDEAKSLFRKNTGTPSRGIRPWNRKNRQSLPKRRCEKERQRQRESDPDGRAARREEAVLLPHWEARALDGLKKFHAKFLPIFELLQAAPHRFLLVNALRECFLVGRFQLLGELLDDFGAAPVAERQGSQFFPDDLLPIRHVEPPCWSSLPNGVRRRSPQCDSRRQKKRASESVARLGSFGRFASAGNNGAAALRQVPIHP